MTYMVLPCGFSDYNKKKKKKEGVKRANGLTIIAITIITECLPCARYCVVI